MRMGLEQAFPGIGLGPLCHHPFVVFQMNDQFGRNFHQQAEAKTPDQFARGPGVEDMGWLPIEHPGVLQDLGVGKDGNLLVGVILARVVQPGHANSCIVSHPAQILGIRSNMHHAVGGEISVMDEEDIHYNRPPIFSRLDRW